MWTIEAVALLVVKGEQICLVRETGSRPKIGKFAGQLSIPMGHINTGEDPENAALREFTEETNLSAMIDYPLGFFQIVMPEGERAAVWAYKGQLLGGSKNAAVVWMSEYDFLSLDPFELRPLNHELYQTYALTRYLKFAAGGEEAVARIVARSMPHVAFHVPTETP